MIVIEPVGVQVPLQERARYPVQVEIPLPERPRYPGKIILPILVPPSPEGAERPLPERKRSSLWFWGLLVGVLALGSSASKTPRLGEAKRRAPYPKKRPTDRLYWMWVAPGKWYQDAISIPKSKLLEYKQRAITTSGSLYALYAESADRARYLLRIDPPSRHSYTRAVAEEERAKRSKARSKAKAQKAAAEESQLTLFSGRIANCAIWIPDGRTGWKCGMYGRACDPPVCAEPTDPTVKQIKVCVKDQKVFSGFYNKLITRCKRYETACEGAACMPITMPYPTEEPEEPKRTEATPEEIKSYAEWMADQYNEEHFEKIPYLAREILSRGGIAPHRTPYGLEPPERSAEEYTMLPLFLRNKKGMPLDEMASEMGMGENELHRAIMKAYPPKERGAWRKIRRKTWRDFKAEAKWDIEEKLYAGEWSGLLSGAPASVWKTTYKDYVAAQREDDDPALPSQLNWILKRTKVNEEGDLRVFKGNLPGHMHRKLTSWLWGKDQERRRSEQLKRPPDKSLKVVYRSGRGLGGGTYNITLPTYSVTVDTYHKSDQVQVIEWRSNFHGRSVLAALIEGKPVPKKVVEEYAPFIPLARQVLELKPGAAAKAWREPEQLRLLGQELFPGLRRELKLEPAQDPATSDDPVVACMERLGWSIPRMEQLKASISEKLTPDLFTGKIKRLSPGEREYQRVMGECLAASSGIAGFQLLGRRPLRI